VLILSFREYIQTAIPSSDTLKSLNLREGENDLTYVIADNPSQQVEIRVKIFLYASNKRLVVSDIDGTITK
jgi:phosphatidate phosphatase LPIN